MGKLIFTYTDKEFLEIQREASKIEFDVPDDMDMNEFKVMCVRLASAMGYHEKSIKRAFGDLIFGDDDLLCGFFGVLFDWCVSIKTLSDMDMLIFVSKSLPFFPSFCIPVLLMTASSVFFFNRYVVFWGVMNCSVNS